MSDISFRRGGIWYTRSWSSQELTEFINRLLGVRIPPLKQTFGTVSYANGTATCLRNRDIAGSSPVSPTKEFNIWMKENW